MSASVTPLQSSLGDLTFGIFHHLCGRDSSQTNEEENSLDLDMTGQIMCQVPKWLVAVSVAADIRVPVSKAGFKFLLCFGRLLTHGLSALDSFLPITF